MQVTCTKFLSIFLGISVCKIAYYNIRSDKIGIILIPHATQRLLRHILLDKPYRDPHSLLLLPRMIHLSPVWRKNHNPGFLNNMSIGGRKCASWVATSFVLRCGESKADKPRKCSAHFSSLKAQLSFAQLINFKCCQMKQWPGLYHEGLGINNNKLLRHPTHSRTFLTSTTSFLHSE